MKPLFVLFLFVNAGVSSAESHVERLVAAARQKIEKNPQSADAYSDLAFALARRSREKADPRFDTEAEQAVVKSLQFSPANFEARKARVIIRLHQRRYADALEEAQALNKQIPDDNLMYGLMSDAYVGLGSYKEAEARAQRMLDMRQVNAPGLQRGAVIREAVGYLEGALEWWNSSLRITNARDEEERAFLLTQLGRVNRSLGRYDAAAQYLKQALEQVPDYPLALTELARVSFDQQKNDDAAQLLRKRLQNSEDLVTRYWLAMALQKPDAGAEAWEDFERKATAAKDQPVNANRELVLYYADHGKTEAAVKLARTHLANRRDRDSQEAYAWALCQAGDCAAARAPMAEALSFGVRDSDFFYHAGVISRKVNDAVAANAFFRKCLEVSASSPAASAAIRELSAASGSGTN